MKSRTGDVRDMRREIQWLTGDDRRVNGERGFYSSTQGMCTWAGRGLHGTGEVYRGWQVVHRLMTGKTLGMTGKERVFLYGQGFLESVTKTYVSYPLWMLCIIFGDTSLTNYNPDKKSSNFKAQCTTTDGNGQQ